MQLSYHWGSTGRLERFMHSWVNAVILVLAGEGDE